MQLCHHCFEPLREEAAFPCKLCQLAWYCSDAHRSADRSHHPGGPSCGVPWTALLPEGAVLATRLATAAKACDSPILCVTLSHCTCSTFHAACISSLGCLSARLI